MKMFRLTGPWATTAFLALVVLFAAALPARAGLLINNGGFEAGFTSWTRADQLGSDGMFFLQSGTASPVNGDPVPAPPQGIRAAMTDSQGPGSHVLYQDFLVPTEGFSLATLSFSLFIGNRASAFATPASLDFSTPALNQQARVDILRGGTDPFSVSAADVLLNAYQTRTTDPLISGYTTTTLDITSFLSAHRGETLRLRFAEVDNLFTFQLGVDNVDVTVIPEPSSLVLLGVGALLGVARYRRRLRP